MSEYIDFIAYQDDAIIQRPLRYYRRRDMPCSLGISLSCPNDMMCPRYHITNQILIITPKLATNPSRGA